MRRYFFHVKADNLEVPDLVGVELANPDAVREHAEKHRADIWTQRVLAGKQPLVGWLKVVDHEERGVLNLPL
jgi:hypothetical protein